MQHPEYDIIIVGARCAGATLATFLARRGASVLLLDKDPLPSDQVLSTHTIHPPGIEVLDEVGVGREIRKSTPATRILRLRKNSVFVDLQYENGRSEFCPRRKHLDGLLQRKAVEAGAQLFDRTRVHSLVKENGRVSGVKTVRAEREEIYRAGLVVGADGRHSVIAKFTGASEYLGYDAPRAMYWGYWDAPPSWKDDSVYPFGMYIGHVGDQIRVIFQTDCDQLLIGSLPPVSKAAIWRGDPLAALKADLVCDPVTRSLVGDADPVGKVRGTVKERYYFRDAAGPGWILVGDAGHHKEFVIGDGITEALLQARSLAEAISVGTETALVRWWRARDVEALPLYFFGQDEGTLGSPSELDVSVLSRVAERSDLRARMS
jgi:flavin-dependent dehydrogenase